MTILRRRSPQGQDSAEHQEGCIGNSNTAVEFKDGAFRRLRLPRTELFAEGMEEKCVVFRLNKVRRNGSNSVYRYGKFFRRPDPTPVERWLYKEQHRDCAVSMQQTSDGVTSSQIVP